MNKQALKRHIKNLKPSLIGRVLAHINPYRKSLVLQNMRFVFGDSLEEHEINRLVQAFYSHVARSLKENLLMRVMSLKQIQQKAEVRGLENLQAIIANQESMLVLTGHFGNWEFAPIAGILNFNQYQGRFYFIRKMITTKWIEKLLFSRFYQAGLNVIPKENALNQALDVLESNNAVVFVMDQYAYLRKKDGINVEFFGKKTGTYKSLAMLAQYTKVPVVPATSYRLPSGKHVLEFFKPLQWVEHDNRRQEIYENTLIYNQTLEKLVLAHPEQWNWFHRRWRD